jgi:hypothetical protein
MNPRGMSEQATARDPLFNIPQNNSRLQGSRGKIGALWLKSNGSNAGGMGQAPRMPCRLGSPQAHGLISAGSGNGLPISANSHGLNSCGVAFQEQRLLFPR